MTLFRKFLILSLAAALSAVSFAQSDPKALLQEINQYRVAQFNEARQSGKAPDMAVLNAAVKARAEAAVKDVDPAKVDLASAYEWAQLFQLAGRHKSVCDLMHRLLITDLDAPKRFQAQMLMISSCNELGEAEMLSDTLRSIKPPTAAQGSALASQSVYVYADTIAKAKGPDAAIAALYSVLASIPKEDPKERAKVLLTQAKAREAAANRPSTESDESRLAKLEEQVKNQEISMRFMFADKRSELLADAGRRTEALKVIDDFLGALDEKSPIRRSAMGSRTRLAILNGPAPALDIAKGYGAFPGFEALKGKVVILDFFAHWCGPCIASFPDMRKMLSELKDQGLEMYGITTYYGYYGAENREKRDMPQDVEYAKMADFIKDKNVTWPVLYGDRSNFDKYGVTGIPHVVVLDKAGNVHKIHIGYSPSSFGAFRKEIEELLKK